MLDSTMNWESGNCIAELAAEPAFREHLLRSASLVTANFDLAQKCVEAGLQMATRCDAQEENDMEWCRSWVLQCALNAVQPQIASGLAGYVETSYGVLDGLHSNASTHFFEEQVWQALFVLDPLLRIVYVLRILEQLTRPLCCRLLGISADTLCSIERSALLRFTAAMLDSNSLPPLNKPILLSGDRSTYTR